jgi:hypothetical protein
VVPAKGRLVNLGEGKTTALIGVGNVGLSGQTKSGEGAAVSHSHWRSCGRRSYRPRCRREPTCWRATIGSLPATKKERRKAERRTGKEDSSGDARVQILGKLSLGRRMRGRNQICFAGSPAQSRRAPWEWGARRGAASALADTTFAAVAPFDTRETASASVGLAGGDGNGPMGRGGTSTWRPWQAESWWRREASSGGGGLVRRSTGARRKRRLLEPEQQCGMWVGERNGNADLKLDRVLCKPLIIVLWPRVDLLWAASLL